MADLSTKQLEELLQEAENAPEPGTLRVKDILHSGEGDLPAPMVVSALDNAGYAYVYDTQTRERSVVNRNMLPGLLRKVREDGSRVFTTQKPSSKPKRGRLCCLLHPSNPNRAHYDELGLSICQKTNLINPLQVSRHMQHRHKDEWAAIEQERITREREEDRELQKQLVGKIAERPPLYVSEKDRKGKA